MESVVGLFGKKDDCEQYIKAINHTFYGLTDVITHLGSWENTHYSKLIESVVYCFFKIPLSKTDKYKQQAWF